MPHYQTRVLTARDRLLVDRLAKFPRYAPLVSRLTARPHAKGKAAKAHEAPAPADTPADPDTAATGHDNGAAGHAVPKPKPTHKPTGR
jgi:hypothetical protein